MSSAFPFDGWPPALTPDETITVRKGSSMGKSEAMTPELRAALDPGRAVFDALVKDEDPRDRTSQLGLGGYAAAREGKTILEGTYDLARVGRELAVGLSPSFRGSGIEVALKVASEMKPEEPRRDELIQALRNVTCALREDGEISAGDDLHLELATLLARVDGAVA